MKLDHVLIAPLGALALCVGLAGACSPKNSGGGGTKSPDTATSGGGDGGAAPAGADCGATVADTPTLLFGDQVILRPPLGVEFPPDDNPMVQTAVMSGGFMSTCDAMVKRVLVFVYETDAKKSPADLVEEFLKTLEPQGYTGGTKSGPQLDTATDYHISMEYGASGGGEAAVLYLGVARRDDKDFIVVFETTPDDFKILEPTFTESAKSLFVVPPDA